MTTTLTIRAGHDPVWLCFEPWANEYTVAPGTTVAVTFDDDQSLVEITYHRDGIIFHSLGKHPDIWTVDGEPVEIFSDTMPETPRDVDPGLFHVIRELVPPRRP